MASKSKSEMFDILQQSGYLNQETIQKVASAKVSIVDKVNQQLQIISLAKKYAELDKKGGAEKHADKMAALKAEYIQLIGDPEKSVKPKIEVVKQSLALLEKAKSEGSFDSNPSVYEAKKASLESQQKVLNGKLSEFNINIKDFESGRLINPKKEKGLETIRKSPEQEVGHYVRSLLSEPFTIHMENDIAGVNSKGYQAISRIINENWSELKGLQQSEQKDIFLGLMHRPEYSGLFLDNLKRIKQAYETQIESIVTGIQLAGGKLTEEDKQSIQDLEISAQATQSDIDNFDQYLAKTADQTTKGQAFSIALDTAAYKNKVHSILEAERIGCEQRGEPFTGLSVSDIKARLGEAGAKLEDRHVKEYCDIAEGVKKVDDKYISHPIEKRQQAPAEPSVQQSRHKPLPDTLNTRLANEISKIHDLSDLILKSASLSANERTNLRTELTKQKIELTKIQAEIIAIAGIDHPAAKQIPVALRQIDKALEDSKSEKSKRSLSMPGLRQHASEYKVPKRSESTSDINKDQPSADDKTRRNRTLR